MFCGLSRYLQSKKLKIREKLGKKKIIGNYLFEFNYYIVRWVTKSMFYLDLENDLLKSNKTEIPTYFNQFNLLWNNSIQTSLIQEDKLYLTLKINYEK